MAHHSRACVLCSALTDFLLAALLLFTPPLASFAMQRLADVELQSIMHGLDLKSLLFFARCSRQLLRLVDTRFAWKFTVRHVTFPAPSSCPPPTSLFRHAPVVLRSSVSGVDQLAQLFAVAVALNVKKLHLPWGDALLPNECMRTILAHPSMQQLRVLWIHSTALDVKNGDESEARLVTTLPRLHILSIHTGYKTATRWSLLPAAPALTSLIIREGSAAVDEGCLRYLNSCTKITQLTISGSALRGGGFRSLFTSPSMQRLRTLTLKPLSANRVDWDDAPPVAAGDLVAAFTALTHLQTLTLNSCRDLDDLLPHLSSATALRSLVVEVKFISDEGEVADCTPSRGALLQLLTALPSLRCRMLLQRTFFHYPAATLAFAEQMTGAVGQRFALGWMRGNGSA